MSTTVLEPVQVIEKVHAILNKCDIPDRHTFFQIEKFVIGKEPTVQGKLWQIVRELDVKLDTFDAYQKQIEDAEDNLELVDVKIEKLDLEIKELSKNKTPYGDLEIREREINIRKKERGKKSLIRATRKLNHKLRSLVEEMAYLSMGFEKIAQKHGDIKPFDDTEVQHEWWSEKLLEEFNLRVLLQRPFDIEFVRTILCMHDEAPVKKHMVANLQKIQQEMLDKAGQEKNRKQEVI